MTERQWAIVAMVPIVVLVAVLTGFIISWIVIKLTESEVTREDNMTERITDMVRSSTIYICAKGVDELPPVPTETEMEHALIIELDDGVLKLNHNGTVELSGGLKKKDIPRIIQQAAKIVHYAITMDAFSTDK